MSNCVIHPFTHVSAATDRGDEKYRKCSYFMSSKSSYEEEEKEKTVLNSLALSSPLLLFFYSLLLVSFFPATVVISLRFAVSLSPINCHVKITISFIFISCGTDSHVCVCFLWCFFTFILYPSTVQLTDWRYNFTSTVHTWKHTHRHMHTHVCYGKAFVFATLLERTMRVKIKRHKRKRERESAKNILRFNGCILMQS